MKRFWFSFLALFTSSASIAETITLLGNNLDDSYQMSLLRLAIEHSQDIGGETYTLELSPPMGDLRAEESVKSGRYENPVRVGIPGMAEIKMDFIQFPTQLGTLGYRICFHRDALTEQANSITKLEQLQDYTFGGHKSWSEYNVFTHNNIVMKGVDQAFIKRVVINLYKSTAEGKVDFFCRPLTGYIEDQQHISFPKNLVENRHFALHYHKPVMLATFDNPTLHDKIYTGLKRAHENGSLQKVWEKKYLSYIQAARMKQRIIFELENPELTNFPKDFTQYNYNPATYQHKN